MLPILVRKLEGQLLQAQISNSVPLEWTKDVRHGLAGTQQLTDARKASRRIMQRRRYDQTLQRKSVDCLLFPKDMRDCRSPLLRIFHYRDSRRRPFQRGWRIGSGYPKVDRVGTRGTVGGAMSLWAPKVCASLTGRRSITQRLVFTHGRILADGLTHTGRLREPCSVDDHICSKVRTSLV